MFLRAGAVSLVLLVASRLLGLVRESAQAAAFGATGVADAVVLMLSLPDWLAGVAAAGALSYVLLPAWAAQAPAQVAALQRWMAAILLAGAALVGLLLLAVADAAVGALAPGLRGEFAGQAAQGLAWCAAALPAALLAALWAARLQFERDFAGVYAGSLVVNAMLIAALGGVALLEPARTSVAIGLLGAALLLAMLLRLGWQRLRLAALPAVPVEPLQAGALPAWPLWLSAMLAAGLPLALPFVARSLASGGGEGALATFNYAWKLVELPLVLAIQLVAALALPTLARVFAGAAPATDADDAVRRCLALAWVAACAAAAGLLVAAPALAQLLFGWGRMPAQALETVAQWGRVGAWGLLPQSLIAVAVAVLAARRRLALAGLAHLAALVLLLAAGASGVRDGATLMAWLNLLAAAVALALLFALGPALRRWVPWRAVIAAAVVLVSCAWSGARWMGVADGSAGAVQLALGAAASLAVVLGGYVASADLRAALRR